MLRFIVRTVDIVDAVNAGGPVAISYKTFDLFNSALEEYLREPKGEWVKCEVAGVEVRPSHDLTAEPPPGSDPP